MILLWLTYVYMLGDLVNILSIGMQVYRQLLKLKYSVLHRAMHAGRVSIPELHDIRRLLWVGIVNYCIHIGTTVSCIEKFAK